MRRLGIVLVLVTMTGCAGPGRFLNIRINPAAIGRTAKDATKELVHGLLHTVGRVVDVILR